MLSGQEVHNSVENPQNEAIFRHTDTKLYFGSVNGALSASQPKHSTTNERKYSYFDALPSVADMFFSDYNTNRTPSILSAPYT